MAFADFYLHKFSQPLSIIQENPDPDLGFIIVIPSYKEEQLMNTIESLSKCFAPRKAVEVIVVINAPEDAPTEALQTNETSLIKLREWIENHQDHFLKIFPISILLPEREAGVGLARKIGMDEAVRRFNSIENKKGWIAGFDADSTCKENFLVELENSVNEKPKATGCSIHYEHPLEGNEFASQIYTSVQLYELYLRYYIECLRYCLFPFAFHTLGSSFAVNVQAYCHQGGMNKRKAGEDFYFLHKIIPLGNYFELNSTTIYPSPRVSDRVPFGTGSAIGKMIVMNDSEYLTFHPESFGDLKKLFENLEPLYKVGDIQPYFNNLPEPLKEFLTLAQFQKAVQNANANSSSFSVFKKRFFQWMNGLMVLQYMNSAHQTFFKKIPVTLATNLFLFGHQEHLYLKAYDLVTLLRNKQKSFSYLPPGM